MRNLLASLGDERDWTPPRLGTIQIEQTGPSSASCKFSGFLEDESEILSTQFEMREGAPTGRLLFCMAFGGLAESWSGELHSAPAHGSRVYACITSTNTHDRSASMCADPLLWDAAAPVIQNFYTVNPVSGNWRVKLPCEVHPDPCMGSCTPGGLVDPNCEPRVYTNTSEILRFGLRLGPLRPDFETFVIKDARWAMSTGGRCATVGCTDALSVARGARLQTVFKSIGNTEALTLGRIHPEAPTQDCT